MLEGGGKKRKSLSIGLGSLSAAAVTPTTPHGSEARRLGPEQHRQFSERTNERTTRESQVKKKREDIKAGFIQCAPTGAVTTLYI